MTEGIAPMDEVFVPLMAGLWLAWMVSWHVAALWRGVKRDEAPRREYRLHFAIAIAGFVMVFWSRPTTAPLWPVGEALGWAMVALTAAGFAFAWWARIHLGRLWSGGVVLREDHRVVDSGPYALVRHPIYTGLFVAVSAMAAVRATPLALAGAALFVLGFTLKARVEERFIEQALPGYAAYRRRVGMILPWIGR
jgi:protein-S-isoprenylcysteine O-methyltransferase Ste14